MKHQLGGAREQMGSWDVHLFIVSQSWPDDDVVDKLNASHEGCTDCALL